MEKLEFEDKAIQRLNFESLEKTLPEFQKVRELKLQEYANIELTEDFKSLRQSLSTQQSDADIAMNDKLAEEAVLLGANPASVYAYVKSYKPDTTPDISLEKAVADNQISESLQDNPNVAVNSLVDKHANTSGMTKTILWNNFLDNLANWCSTRSVARQIGSATRMAIDPQFHMNAVAGDYFLDSGSLKLKGSKSVIQDIKNRYYPIIDQLNERDTQRYLEETYNTIIAKNPNPWILSNVVDQLREGVSPYEDYIGLAEVVAIGANIIKDGFKMAKAASNVTKMNKIAAEQVAKLDKPAIVEELITPSATKPLVNPSEISASEQVADTVADTAGIMEARRVALEMSNSGVYNKNELKVLTDYEKAFVDTKYKHTSTTPVDVSVIEDRDGALQTIMLFGDDKAQAMTRDGAIKLAEDLGLKEGEFSVVTGDRFAGGYYIQVVKSTSSNAIEVMKGNGTFVDEVTGKTKTLTEQLTDDWSIKYASPTASKTLGSISNWFARFFAGSTVRSAESVAKDEKALRSAGGISDFMRRNYEASYDALSAQDKVTIHALQKKAAENDTWLMKEVSESDLPEAVKTAWYDYKRANDVLYCIENEPIRKNMIRKGLKKYGDMYGREVPWKVDTKSIVVDVKGRSIENMAQLDKANYKLIELEKVSVNIAGWEATHMVVPASYSAKEIPMFVLPYIAGGRRIYTGGNSFVKIGSSWFNPATGSKLNGFAKTIIAGKNVKALQQYADDVNKVIDKWNTVFKRLYENDAVVARAEVQKWLDKEANLQQFKVRSWEELEDLIKTKDNPTGLIDPDYKAKVLKDKQRYVYDNALETVIDNANDSDAALQELIHYASLRTKHRSHLLDDINGGKLRILDMQDTYNKVIQKASLMGATNDYAEWYAKNLHRFKPVLKNYSSIKDMSARNAINSVMFDTGRRGTMTPEELELLRAGQRYVEHARGILDSKTTADIWVNNCMNRLAETFGIDMLSKAHPGKLLRRLNFMAIMGMWNPAQLMKQMLGTTTVLALEPVKGPKATMAYIPVRLARAAKEAKNVEAYNKYRKIANSFLGTTDKEFDGLMKYMGKYDTKGSSGLLVGYDRNYGDALNRDKSLFAKAWDSQYWFMREGNAANYYIADITAWLAKKDQGTDAVLGYAADLFANMTRGGESAFQRGQVLGGIGQYAAQWMSYPMRMIEAMFNTRLSKTQRISLAVTQLGMWGVGGTLGNKAFDLWFYDNLVENADVDPDIAEGITNGALGWLGHELGVDLDEGVRAYEQFERIFDIFDLSEKEIHITNIPAGQAVSQLGATFGAMVELFKVPTNPDYSFMRWCKYVATHPNIASSLRNGTKAALAVKYGEFYNKYGYVITDDATNTQAFFQLIGFGPYANREESYKYEARLSRKEKIEDGVASVKDIIDGLRFVNDYEDNEVAQDNLWNEFKTQYDGMMSLYEPDVQQEILKKVLDLLNRNQYNRQTNEELKMNKEFNPVMKNIILRRAKEIEDARNNAD